MNSIKEPHPQAILNILIVNQPSERKQQTNNMGLSFFMTHTDNSWE